MANWTSPADVEARWVGGGFNFDPSLVGLLIEDAENVILARFPRIQERVTAGTLSQDAITLVTVRMVSRVLRNPENLTYVQQTTGPFGQARNYGSTSSDIWLTDDELRMLAPVTRGKAYSFSQAPNARPGIPVVPYQSDISFGDLDVLIQRDIDE